MADEKRERREKETKVPEVSASDKARQEQTDLYAKRQDELAQQYNTNNTNLNTQEQNAIDSTNAIYNTYDELNKPNPEAEAKQDKRNRWMRAIGAISDLGGAFARLGGAVGGAGYVAPTTTMSEGINARWQEVLDERKKKAEALSASAMKRQRQSKNTRCV